MKIQLRKNLKPHALRWDEMYSVLTEAEAILNSRPLAPLHTEESTEGTFLTAGHFLVGRPLKAPPVRLPSTSKYSLLRRWDLVTRIKADLWKTWSSSYLASCAQRSKWLRPGYRLHKGDIVFVKDESIKTRDWPIAIVEDVHPGDDGKTRVATIRCRGKLYRRPVVRLIPVLTDDVTSSTPPGSMSGTPTQPEP